MLEPKQERCQQEISRHHSTVLENQGFDGWIRMEARGLDQDRRLANVYVVTALKQVRIEFKRGEV